MKVFHEIDAGYYLVQFWKSSDLAKYGVDNIPVTDMMIDFDKFDLDKIKADAAANDWDRIKVTKYQEVTTLYGLGDINDEKK